MFVIARGIKGTSPSTLNYFTRKTRPQKLARNIYNSLLNMNDSFSSKALKISCFCRKFVHLLYAIGFSWKTVLPLRRQKLFSLSILTAFAIVPNSTQTSTTALSNIHGTLLVARAPTSSANSLTPSHARYAFPSNAWWQWCSRFPWCTAQKTLARTYNTLPRPCSSTYFAWYRLWLYRFQT